MVKKIILGVVALVLLAAIAGGLFFAKMSGVLFQSLDHEPPLLPAGLHKPAVLVFSKANGYVHTGALPAGKKLLDDLAKKNNWSIYQTENGAVMTEELLSQFDVVVWNNTSGTTLTEAQQEAFKAYILGGGGFVGIHAAGGDPNYTWPWYVNTLIGAQFIGHTMSPQFQDADVLVAEPGIPMLAFFEPNLKWTVPQEEWYAFSSNVRDLGYTVLLTLDESSYDPNDAFMPGEHPIAWRHTLQRGRAFYSAIGHQAATYDIPEFQQLIENGVRWAGQLP